MNDELAAIARDMVSEPAWKWADGMRGNDGGIIFTDDLGVSGFGYLEAAGEWPPEQPDADDLPDLNDHGAVWAIFGLLVSEGQRWTVTDYSITHGLFPMSRTWNVASDGPHYFAKALLYGLRLLSQKEDK